MVLYENQILHFKHLVPAFLEGSKPRLHKTATDS